MSVRSLALSGSPSAPFTSTRASPPPRSATVCHFRPTGNAPPPRPRSPLAVISPIRSPAPRSAPAQAARGAGQASRGRPRAAGRQAGAVPRQPRRSTKGAGRRDSATTSGRSARRGRPSQMRARQRAITENMQPTVISSEPARESIAAGTERVRHRQRPAGIGEPVHQAPRSLPDLVTQQAGGDHGDDCVDRDDAQADPQRAIRRGERDGRGRDAQRGKGIDDCGHRRAPPTKATDSSARLLCRSADRKRGQPGRCQPVTEMSPSTATPVSRISETIPAPRVANHRS